MRFFDFVRTGKVRKSRPDLQLSKSLVRMSENHLVSIGGLELNCTTSSTIMTTYYEALREVVEAVATKEGYKVYSHEAFTYFLKDKGENLISLKFDKFRKIRNNINYYGKSIGPLSVKSYMNEIEKMIDELKQKYLSGV